MDDGGPVKPVEHVYLHVPFCRTHCPYCDYAVTVDAKPADAPADATAGVVAPVDAWLASVAAELEWRGGTRLLATPLVSILVGGGTPSFAGHGLIPGIRRLLGPERLAGVREWTVEANPEDLDAALLDEWCANGVTRVNLGLQSPDEGPLRWLGRRHSAAVGDAAIALLAASFAEFTRGGRGIPTFGVDFLYGLPREVDADPTGALRRVLRRSPPHVSLYELVAESGTPLGEGVAAGEIILADDDERARLYLELVQVLEDEGYRGYEFRSFAWPGHESVHHRAVLGGADLLGMGPGAHGSIGGRRHWNLRDWGVYLTTVRAGGSPEAGWEVPGEEEIALDRLWSGLALAEGVSREGLPRPALDLADAWKRAGWALDDPKRIRLTPEGWLRMDGLTMDLAATRHSAAKGEG